MKKLLSIIILTLSLSGCKTNVDYPTSIFGVELPNDVTNYMYIEEDLDYILLLKVGLKRFVNSN